jgi:opacity protein-like surface antigen
MKLKLAVVVSCLALAVPALAQVAITPTPRDDQTRPRRGLTPEEQQRFQEQDQQRELQRQQEEGGIRSPQDYNTPRTYEGRASFVGARPGKCPLNGSVRATVRGNTIDASLTFPIERDAIHGYIAGSRFQAIGNFGYSIQGNVTEGGITGSATKRQQVKASPQKPVGTPIPFLPGPTTAQPTPPPLVQDCVYAISLSRVS